MARSPAGDQALIAGLYSSVEARGPLLPSPPTAKIKLGLTRWYMLLACNL